MLNLDDKFDLTVIGGGPGGYVAAIRAAQLGKKVAVIERQHLGGICLNWGCIPTKALLHTAEVLDEIRHCDQLGLSTGHVSLKLDAIIKRSRTVSAQLSRGVAHLLKKNKVTVIDGHGRLVDRQTIAVFEASVDQHERSVVSDRQIGAYQSNDIIIATGSRARSLPGLEPDHEQIVTYHQAMVPTDLPSELLIIGSGAIGVEFASFYRSLGSMVTLVEALPQILPAEDSEIAAIVSKRLQSRGIAIRTEQTVTAIDRGKKLVAHLSSGESLTVDRVISAVGVVGNTEDLGLEALEVAVDKGRIVTSDYGRTTQAGIYAIGDVAGAPMLAHKASHEAIACVEAISGLETHRLERERIPACTYSDPQVASIGLTEQQALDAAIPIRVGRFPFAGNGKAIALGREQGLVKTIFHQQTGGLIGAHLVGANVTELIHGFAVAMTLETTEADLLQTVFPHPTLSEMIPESVLAAFDRPLHI